MRSRDVSWVATLAISSVIACYSERTFRDAENEVGSGGENSGGDTNGGDEASGGDGNGSNQTPADGGDAGSHPPEGIAGAGGDSGGAEAGGAEAGGAEAGGAEAGGAGNAGQPEAPGGGTSSAGPVRVGFSVFRDSAGGFDDASGDLTDATFAKPEGTAEGDFLLVFFGADHSLAKLSGSELDDTDWKLIDQREEYGMDGQAVYLLYRFAGASEPDSIVFAGINPENSGVGVQGLLSVYRGVNSEFPINAYAAFVDPVGSDTTTNVTTETPPITTSVAGCLAVAGLSPDTEIDAPVVTSWPEGFTDNRISVTNLPNPYPNGWANIYAAERRLPEAGDLPASAFDWEITYGGTLFDGALSFVLALAP